MRWMFATVAMAGLGMSLQGCAETVDPSPSYLGFAPPIVDDATAKPVTKPSTSTSHVSSNKVLGAMAFQKTTGRTVDPGRLSENR